MIELTPSQIIYKELFEMIREKQEALRKTMLYHMVAHEQEGHIIVPLDPDILEKLKTNKWASTGAICAVCNKSFGWWCPKSPDHLCHYKPIHNYPQSEEICIHCGQLEERR